MVELEEKLKKLKGRRPAVSTYPDPRELPETKPPTNEYAWRDPWLQLHM